MSCYLLITLLTLFGKLFEALINTEVLKHMTCKNSSGKNIILFSQVYCWFVNNNHCFCASNSTLERRCSISNLESIWQDMTCWPSMQTPRLTGRILDLIQSFLLKTWTNRRFKRARYVILLYERWDPPRHYTAFCFWSTSMISQLRTMYSCR